MPEAIQIDSITVQYDDLLALDNINEYVGPSETVCIIGPSGSGKSTLLKVIAGLEIPDEGRILYGTQDFYHSRENVQMQIQFGSGFIFQDAALLANMNLFDNLALPLRYHFQYSSEKIRNLVLEQLEYFDLSRWQQLRPAQLSIGKRKLASLARALILNPQYLFFDDPTSNIDKAASAMVDNIIREKHQSGQTSCLLTTGDIELATSLADRIIILFNGKVAASGTTSQIMASKDPFVRKIIKAIEFQDDTIAEEQGNPEEPGE